MRNHAEDPKRVQRKRVAGWRMSPNTVYVGRPTKWGNPCPLKSPENQEWFNHRFATEQFSYWIQKEEQAELRDDIRLKLKGKNLACWCREGLPCHADVLLEIANDGQELDIF